jgi:hypothetical protein
MLYTYGYYGRTADHLKNIAIEKDAIVVDCRKRPYGRQVEFNANSLRRVLGEDRYWHVPELGNVNYQNGGPIVLEDEAKGIGWATVSTSSFCACARTWRCATASTSRIGSAN